MTGPLRPRPVVTKDSAFFWEGTKQHRLLIQRCLTCRRLRHPPSPGCAACGSPNWDSIASAGNGEVYSFTVVHAPATPAFKPVYVVALVALAEGTRLVAELVEIEPAEVRIGMRVRLQWLEPDPDLTLPAFRREPDRRASR